MGRTTPRTHGLSATWMYPSSQPEELKVPMSPQRIPFDDVVRDPLLGLRVQLTAEYGDLFPRHTIDEMARHALAELDGARIREFVPVFAWRHAREHLRQRS